MTKPEPVAWMDAMGMTWFEPGKYREPLFTAAQMRQARVEALRDALALILATNHIHRAEWDVRELIEQESK